MLKFFYLTQLILSPETDERDLGVKLALLLFRFDSNTRLVDITTDAIALNILQKTNTRELWTRISQKRISDFKDDLPTAPANGGLSLKNRDTTLRNAGYDE